MTIELSNFLNQESDIELIKTLPLEQVEKLWNTIQIKTISCPLGLHEYSVKEKCLQELEIRFRKPWDESIFFKIIQMRLDLIEGSSKPLDAERMIKRLFSELEMTCPFIPKLHMKRSLELKVDFNIFKLRDRIIKSKMDLDQVITELVDLLIEHKKRTISIERFGSKILEILRKEHCLSLTKQIESLLPECDEFNGFHVDLLNVATELTLDLAIQARKTVNFSERIIEAIKLNVRSLSIRPNLMGYFEFLKLTKLQDPRDFEQAIETCLNSIRNHISPTEDIRGKLQIIRLIANETGNLKGSLLRAEMLFNNCDFTESGSMILEDLIELIDEEKESKSVTELLEQLFLQFHDQLRGSKRSQKAIQECLLRVAEKNFSVNENIERAEQVLKITQSLNMEDDGGGVKLKMIKCLLKLDKLREVEELLDEIPDEEEGNNGNREYKMVKLDFALRSQNEFQAKEYLEKVQQDSLTRPEHFLRLFNSLKARLTPELQMKLLQAAKNKLTNFRNGKDMKIDILRGIVSILYEGIIESGLEPFKEDLDLQLHELISDGAELSDNQIIWICQVSWNLGVIHARAEDFSNAQFGFKWCYQFATVRINEQNAEIVELIFKAGFYYLTAKMCVSDEKVDKDDLLILESCKKKMKNEFSMELDCLEIEILLRQYEWAKLEEFLKCSKISFETVAELILKASEDVPLKINRIILERLTEEEFNSKSFNITRFSELYRGLTSCALLQFPRDLCYFEKALKIIKTSFGGYPADEVIWLCGTSLEMGTSAMEKTGDYQLATDWTEMAMNLVYLIPEEEKLMRNSLQEAIQNLFERIINRE